MITKEQKTNEFIHIGMVSSYLQLIEGKEYGEVCVIQKKKNVKRVFFLPPVDVDTGDLQKSDIQVMIDHFIEQEDYMKCSKLKQIIDNNKCDEDGWLYLTNRFTN